MSECQKIQGKPKVSTTSSRNEEPATVLTPAATKVVEQGTIMIQHIVLITTIEIETETKQIMLV